MPFFNITLNSATPLHVLLDTGGANSLIDRDRATQLGLAMSRGVASVSGSASLDVGVIPAATLQVGTLEHRTRLIAAPLAALEPIIGRPLEGILGGDFLRRYSTELDYEQRVMRVYDPADLQPTARMMAVPLTLVGDIPFVDLELSLPNGHSLRGSFLVDTAGGRMGVHVHKVIADRDRLLDGAATVEETGYGIGGATKRLVARGSALTLGPFRLQRPVVAITEDTAGLRANPASVGLVGMEVLGRFTVTFDYARSRMFLARTSRVDEPFIYDASGMVLRAERPSFSTAVVSRVRGGSPADVAGVQSGDVLERIDSQRASALGIERIRTLLQRPHQTYKLTLSRGGKEIECVLETRDLLR